MYETVDFLDMAKSFQMEIDMIDDPFDVAREASRAVDTLNLLRDERLQEGVPISVIASGAFALHQWIEAEQRFALLAYDRLCARGTSLGLAFVQNFSPSFRIQTLMVGLQDTDIFELEDNEVTKIAETSISRLTVPVQNIETLELIAA